MSLVSWEISYIVFLQIYKYKKDCRLPIWFDHVLNRRSRNLSQPFCNSGVPSINYKQRRSDISEKKNNSGADLEEMPEGSGEFQKPSGPEGSRYPLWSSEGSMGPGTLSDPPQIKMILKSSH